MTVLPPYLKKGDCIGIMCPAGFMKKGDVVSCIKTLKKRGFRVQLGKTVGGHSKNYFSGPDDARKNELQKMLDDRSIHAILFARGGYGSSRIIDELDFSQFKKHPKWLIGFSDITIILNHVYSNFKVAGIHGPMASAFNDTKKGDFSIQTLMDAIEGKKAFYRCKGHSFNIEGEVKGKLVGGNLALLAHSIGTPSDFAARNHILFIEDIGEYLYNIDRMMLQLRRSGKLKNIKALIVGGFTDTKDSTRPFGKSIEQTILDHLSETGIPVAFGFPVSHENPNAALKIGANYRLAISRKTTILEEI